MSSRRKYDDEFKRRAVQLSYSAERPIKETAESLGVHVSLLNRWRKKNTPTGERTQLSEEEAENRRLRIRVAELENEVDLLKKRQPTLRNINAESRGEVSIDGTRSRTQQGEVGKDLGRIPFRVLYVGSKA